MLYRWNAAIALFFVTTFACGHAAAQAAPTTQLVGFFNDGEYWWLHGKLDYRIGSTQVVVTVPEGFVTDFASIPRPLWTILPPHGRYTRAGIVHDYLYWTKPCTRAEADAIFLDAMAESDVPAVLRYPIYWGVRLFGWWAWYDNKTAHDKGEKRFIDVRYALTVAPNTSWENVNREFLRDGPPVLTAGEDKPVYCNTRLKGVRTNSVKTETPTPSLGVRQDIPTLTVNLPPLPPPSDRVRSTD